MYLTIKHFIEDTTQHIKLRGLLDFSTVDAFNFVEKIPEHIASIDVDFSELEFIDSTGIGAIISILHKANSLGAEVDFIGMSEETKELFETIGVFDIKESLLGEGR
ncbi:STAS domain-containing protein [Neobacillus sp. 114]|uniref:STAS domain-containing protein n=1 Tax=Neobacillus sp. 114 TaxID=3048535 RepID=UPI0024C334CB|nr:STAS domain-containing protein [Neobacillus sp. 114]